MYELTIVFCNEEKRTVKGVSTIFCSRESIIWIRDTGQQEQISKDVVLNLVVFPQ